MSDEHVRRAAAVAAGRTRQKTRVRFGSPDGDRKGVGAMGLLWLMVVGVSVIIAVLAYWALVSGWLERVMDKIDGWRLRQQGCRRVRPRSWMSTPRSGGADRTRGGGKAP